MSPLPERHTAQKESELRIHREGGAEARLCDRDRSRTVETLGSINDSPAEVECSRMAERHRPKPTLTEGNINLLHRYKPKNY